MISDQLKAAYLYHKAQFRFGRMYWPKWAENKGAAERALMYARKDLWEGVSRYPVDGNGALWGALQDDGTRYCENPEKAGLRFVGLAHEVARKIGSRMVDHTGWFTDAFASETIAGVVFRLPAHDRKSRYVVGYSDAWNNGFTVDVSRVFVGDKLDSSYDEDSDTLRDCMIASDGMAERAAESMREYDQAWQAGSQWASRGEEIAECRKDVLSILSEWKSARKDAVNAGRTALCDAIRDKVQSLVSDINQAREKREKLASGDTESFWFSTYDSKLRAAFNEGAGQTVLAV